MPLSPTLRAWSLPTVPSTTGSAAGEGITVLGVACPTDGGIQHADTRWSAALVRDSRCGRARNRLLVLDQGRVIGDAAPADVMANPVVREAYLGTGQEHAAA